MKDVINTSTSVSSRIQSVDFLRGLVMVLMAIDHVRVYSGLPAGGPDPGIFFTRWVTHFCAPVFVLLAGTSAYLYGEKLGDLGKLSRYLLTRGLLLVVMELTIIRFCWTFNFKYEQITLAGVIWMIGWSMVLLAFMVRLKPTVIGIIGMAIIFFQDIFSYVPRLLPESLQGNFSQIWGFIYSFGFKAPFGITILYTIVPWIGVMAAGYWLGTVMKLEEGKRKKLLIRVGVLATILFLIFGTIKALQYPIKGTPFVLQLLLQNKYPASQLFLLMTLGPALLLMPFVEKTKGWISKAPIIFGRVPFAYYLLHIPLIHATALVVQILLYGHTLPELFDTAPFTQIAVEFRWSLGLLYLTFVVDVLILYFLCKRYLDFKAVNQRNTWLRYL